MMVGYMLVAKVGNEGLYYEPAPAEVGTLQFLATRLFSSFHLRLAKKNQLPQLDDSNSWGAGDRAFLQQVASCCPGGFVTGRFYELHSEIKNRSSHVSCSSMTYTNRWW